MRKLLNNPWFVGLAALVALLFVGRTLLPPKPAGVGSVPVGAEIVATSAEDAAVPADSTSTLDPLTSISVEEMLKSLRLPPNPRDPFAARAVVAVVETSAVVKQVEPDLVDAVHLSAVWIQKDAVFALINGHIVQMGDAVGRLKIESATSQGIWLSHWKGRDFLSVGGDFTLNTPAKQALVSTSSL